jgi:hypothetical protein
LYGPGNHVDNLFIWCSQFKSPNNTDFKRGKINQNKTFGLAWVTKNLGLGLVITLVWRQGTFGLAWGN